MKIRYFVMSIAFFLSSGCGTSSASSPFGESTDRCKNWSSLSCEGIPSKATLKKMATGNEGMKYRGQSVESIERITLGEFLGRRTNELERIRYLNGWENSVTLDTPIELNESEAIWIATGGFTPEEFSEYENQYSFAEEDCAAQIRDGKRNGYKCTFIPPAFESHFGTVKGFLKNIGNRVKLEEFVEMNNLPPDTTLSTRVATNRFYKVGRWE